MRSEAVRGIAGSAQALALLLAPLGVFASVPAQAASADDQIALGQELLAGKCGGCHAIGPDGESPFAPAPAFRTLGERYPIEDLEEALAEGILSGHPAMPEFTFEPDQIGAIILYLKSVQQE